MDHTSASIELDTEGTITSAEPGIAVLLGRTAQQLVGLPLSELVEPGDRWLLAQLRHNPEHTQPNNQIRLRRANRTSPITYEITLVRESNGLRVIVSDVLSWRMVERGAATPSTLAPITSPTGQLLTAATNDRSCAFVLRLDQQCRLTDANRAWEEVVEAERELDSLDWMYAFDTATIEAFREALPGICTGASFATNAYVRSSVGRIARLSLAACPLLTADRVFVGFLMVGYEQAPLTDAERVLVQNSVAFPQQAAPTPLPQVALQIVPQIVPPAQVQLIAEPNSMTRMAIASVLSAARADFAGFDDDEPGLFDIPENAIELEARLQPPKLGSAQRAELIDHLDTFHGDGLDAVVTVGLLLIDIETSATNPQDNQYEFRVLEKRLRSAVRDHEYAAPLGSDGFVVAARGDFDRHALEAFAQRITNRLQAPLRGNETSESPTVSIVAITSKIGETDAALIDRIETTRRSVADSADTLFLA
jgi:hypothetical protein